MGTSPGSQEGAACRLTEMGLEIRPLFSCWGRIQLQNRENPLSAPEEGLESLSKGRGEEKGISKASLKLSASAAELGNHLPLLVWLSGSSGPVLALLASTVHRQQWSTQKLKCLTQFLYSWEIHLLSRISLTLATSGISWGQHFPWSFGIWVPSGARNCRIMWSIKNRNALWRQLLLASGSCSLLLFNHLFPTGPKRVWEHLRQPFQDGVFLKEPIS